MNKYFFLKYRRKNNFIFEIVLLLIVVLLCAIYYIVHNKLSIANIISIIIVLLFFPLEIKLSVSGLYINNDNLCFKRLFSKTISAKEIKCIRLSPDFTKGFTGLEYLKDKNGNILYCMDFYASLYVKDEMNGYDFIENLKRLFVEKHLGSCIYNKEALDYILSLNPDIKVFYPEDF